MCCFKKKYSEARRGCASTVPFYKEPGASWILAPVGDAAIKSPGVTRTDCYCITWLAVTCQVGNSIGMATTK